MILKTVKNGRTSFTDIGRNYDVVKREHSDFPELFERQFKGNEKAFEDVFALLFGDGGTSCYPLFAGSYYYILSEGGRQFQTLHSD